MADEGGGPGEEGHRLGELGTFDRRLARRGSDGEGAVVALDPVELVDAVEIHEVLEAGQAERQHRDEALAARERLDLVTVFSEERDDVADGGGRVVFERCRLHVTSTRVSGWSNRRMGVVRRRVGVIRSWGG